MNPEIIKKALPWILIVMVGILGYSAWREARVDRTRVEAELQIKDKLIAELRIERAAIDRGMEARAKETEHLRKDIEELKRRPLPVREIVKEMPIYLSLPGTPTIVEGPAAGPGEKPTEPALLFDPDQVKGLREFYLECHQATLELKACGEDKTDLLQKQEKYQKEIKLLVEERDSAVKAMRGGGIWQRFKRNAKWFAVGIAVGGGAVAAAR